MNEMNALDQLRKDAKFQVVETQDSMGNELILVAQWDDEDQDFVGDSEVISYTDSTVTLRIKASGYEWTYDR